LALLFKRIKTFSLVAIQGKLDGVNENKVVQKAWWIVLFLNSRVVK